MIIKVREKNDTNAHLLEGRVEEENDTSNTT